MVLFRSVFAYYATYLYKECPSGIVFLVQMVKWKKTVLITLLRHIKIIGLRASLKPIMMHYMKPPRWLVIQRHQGLNFFFEFWKVINDYLPHNIIRYGHIIVDDSVAGRDNGSRMGNDNLGKVSCNPTGYFSDNPDVPLDRPA